MCSGVAQSAPNPIKILYTSLGNKANPVDSTLQHTLMPASVTTCSVWSALSPSFFCSPVGIAAYQRGGHNLLTGPIPSPRFHTPYVLLWSSLSGCCLQFRHLPTYGLAKPIPPALILAHVCTSRENLLPQPGSPSYQFTWKQTVVALLSLVCPQFLPHTCQQEQWPNSGVPTIPLPGSLHSLFWFHVC